MILIGFIKKKGHTVYVIKEGLLLWKKWKVYVVIDAYYKLLEELPAGLSLDEVKDYLRVKYPEIVFFES